MEKAIVETLPNTIHLLCTWHICQDLSRAHAKEEVLTQFQQLLYISSLEEFSDKFNALKSGCSDSLKNVLKQLETRKEKWGGPWTYNLFTLNLKTTQRVEITNRLIKRYTKSSTSIQDLTKIVSNVTSRQSSLKPNLKQISKELLEIDAFAELKLHLSNFALNICSSEFLKSNNYNITFDQDQVFFLSFYFFLSFLF